MAEDLVISLNLDDKKISPKLRKLQADFDAATAKVEKQQKAIRDMQKELAYWNDEMARSGKGVSNTMMAEKINPLNQKINEATIKLKQMQAAADLAGQKVDEAMENGTKKSSKMSAALGKVGTAIKDFGKRLVSVAKSAFIFTVLYSSFNKLRQMFSGYLKVNTQFSKSLSLIKGNLLTAFQAIYDAALPAINTLSNALVKATAYASYFFNSLAGKDVSSAAQAAEDLYNQANATDKVTEATEKANKALASFDELNTVDVGNASSSQSDSSSTDTSAPDFGFDYSAINTEFVDNLVDKIKSVVDALKMAWDWVDKNLGGFGGMLELASTIGATILAWKIGKKVSAFFTSLGKNGANIAKLLAGVTITIAGVNFLYDGVKEATINGGYDAESFWKMIGGEFATLLGCTLVGMTLGSIIPGVGTATGALIGLVAGAVISVGTIIKATVDGRREMIDAAIKESELGQTLERLDEEMERQAQLIVDTNATLKVKIDNIETVDSTYNYVQNLVDDIFDLSEVEDKSESEIRKLQALVDEYNSIVGDVGQITLSVDSQQVVESREEVEQLTDAWYDLARAEAEKEYLVELYKAQYKYNVEIKAAISNYDDLMSIYAKWKNAFTKADQEKLLNTAVSHDRLTADDFKSPFAEEVYNYLLGILGDNATGSQVYAEWAKIVANLSEEYEKQTETVSALREGYATATQNLETFESMVSTTSTAVDDLSTSLDSVKSPELSGDSLDSYADSASAAKKATDDFSESLSKLNAAAGSTKNFRVSFGSDTGSSLIRSIPALARGAVLPANRPFLAIVGDQTSGTNVEAPLSTIKQAVRDVLLENVGGYGSEIVIPIFIDGDKVDEAVVRRQDIRNKMRGLALT